MSRHWGSAKKVYLDSAQNARERQPPSTTSLQADRITDDEIMRAPASTANRTNGRAQGVLRVQGGGHARESGRQEVALAARDLARVVDCGSRRAARRCASPRARR